MENWSKLLSAIASLLWPALVIIAFWRFYPDLSSLLHRDRVTIKLPGGAELSAEQAGEAITKSITDLQQKVGELEAKMKGAQSPARDEAAHIGRPVSVLWVDDHPENNALIIAGLGQDRFSFKTALSTDEAVRLAASARYDIIVTDMGRDEGGVSNPAAGIALIRAIQKLPYHPVVAVFASRTALSNYGEDARQLGASFTTNSPTEISNFLRQQRPN